MPTKARKPKAEPNHVQLEPSTWRRYVAARRNREEWEKAEAEARADVEKQLGNNEYGDIGDENVVTYKVRKASRFDQAAFGKKHPEMLELFKKTTEGRYFTPADGEV